MSYNWYKKMVLIRGLPGSGKSTLASNMFYDEFFDDIEAYTSYLVESDNYRIINGSYTYDMKQDSLAHSWCLSETFRRLQSQNVIFVANTFVKREYIFPYLEWARKLEVKVLLTEPLNYWSKDVEELAKKNVHDVPLEIIERMHNSWENFSQTEVEIFVGNSWE